MTLVVILFVVLLLLEMPLAFSIGIAGLSYFLMSDYLPLTISVQKIASASQSFPLLAVPFFVLAGHMMNRTGISDHLIGFSKTLVSWISGGLAHVSIVLSTLMGGVSGSAVADACMEARVLGPSMIKSGLSPGYTAGVIAVSSLITSTIPPSIGLILYGYIGNVSIAKLFIAGILPGFLMMALLMLAAWVIAKRRGYQPEASRRPTIGEVWRDMKDAKWALLFPLMLVVTIRFGIFTPSEAGAFAVVYSVLVGFFAYRTLTVKKIISALHESMNDIGMIMLIIMLSALVGYAIVFERLPQSIAETMNGVTSNPDLMLLLILGFLVLVGMVMEATVSVLLLTPIFVPMIQVLGIDPVHFGILMMIVVTLGGMTPPVGVAMYSVCGILKCPTDRYVIESLPFILTILVMVAILAMFPHVVLFLPNLLM
ncbi:TRAP transporter large permease [Gynuella sunshinyii]|uniref:TRAP transporter large permease protein n=1 Tax=Gynuella sunshinyii YC6258 TaxID=1445510 RepID=A0A0C5VS51_9GAMM|nr:TRAP transporter large permease [Gynuella sunshinyii]AJQ97051.1 TRAP-type C4-dicarboxylate transport system, large permease component [Gynuella sunshinyii YC6258]